MRLAPLIFFVSMILILPGKSLKAQEIRAVPDSVVTQLQKDRDFRYANDPSFWKKENSQNNVALARMLERLANSTAARWLFYLIMGALVVFVLYQVARLNNFFDLSGKKKKTKKAEEELIPEDVEGLLREAISTGNHRVAIRCYFLLTLQNLQAAKRIKSEKETTNGDYILQMSQDADAELFRQLAGVYEYVWYGQFQPSDTQFARIQSRFHHFLPPA